MEHRGREVTLTELLKSRENRAAYQWELLEKYGGVLISFTLNIPGSVKDIPAYRSALSEGMERMKSALENMGNVKLCFMQKRWFATGPEGYFCLKLAGGCGVGANYGGDGCKEGDRGREGECGDEELALAVKREAVAIENGSRLGRLFDIDVLTKNGGISRQRLGAAPRTCLLCGEDAKVCARGQRHSMEELLAEIDRILEEAGL